MSIKRLCSLIPNDVRSELLITTDDPIYNAIPVRDNKEMMLLARIWYEFIEPNKDKEFNCSICLQNILTNFRQMKSSLIELENEYRMLKEL